MEEELKALAAVGPAGRPGTADEIASAVAYLATDAASFVHGAIPPRRRRSRRRLTSPGRTRALPPGRPGSSPTRQYGRDQGWVQIDAGQKRCTVQVTGRRGV
ncbi:hypothetical protein [Streptomyces sp. S.PB5]|uniref:hypothetical protein n=1 Tax=Streptomyces sp. S.PB5 TaxID=3020844 RepID=UPI0025AF5938|nr:hypothetical protein [Streptomyces sp. S.PB5]MDN3028038.1 hypothetical protein [Streptomyces sp. S.PB5]